MKQVLRKLNIAYFALQVLFWGAAVVNYAYMTQILQSKGFSGVEIGILNGAKLLVGVVFQIWIGAFADRRRYSIPLKYDIALLAAVSALLTVALRFAGHSFVLMLCIAVGFGIAFTSLQPLIDSLAMLYCSHGIAVNYAKGRAGGSVSWAILCVLAGVYCDVLGLASFPLCGVGLLIALAAAAFRLPWQSIRPENAVPESDAVLEKPHSVSFLLHEYPAFTVFLIGSIVMFMGYNLGSTFLIDVFTGLGGGNTEYGIAEFVMAIAEVPSAFIILRCKKRLPMELVMVCCSIFMTLKNLIPTCTDSIAVVIAAQTCEMLGLGLYYSGSIYFIEENLPKADIVKGAALISVATIGLGEGIASLLCGVIREQAGLYGLMKTATLTNAVSVLVFIAVLVLKKREACKGS